MNLVPFPIIKYMLACCLLAASGIALSGVENRAAGEAAAFEVLLEAIHAKFQKLPAPTTDRADGHAIFTHPCSFPLPAPQRFEARALRAEADDLRNDLGLELRGRIASDTVTDNENQQASRGYLELSWDLLEEGFLENRAQARALKARAQLLELRDETNRIRNTQRCVQQRLGKVFAGYTARILALKLALMEAIYQIEKRAYFKGWRRYDELVVSDSELKLARHELSYLYGSPYFDDAIGTVINPPAIDIDMEKLIANIRADDVSVRQAQLEKEIIRQQQLARKDNQVRFFLRDSVLSQNSLDPTNIAVGVRFQIPLARKSDAALRERYHALDERKKLRLWERVARVREIYDDVRFQQKQLIKQHARFLRAEERLRQTLTELKLGRRDLLPLAATRLRTILDAGYELIQAKQSLYQRVNQVFAAAGVSVKPEFIHPLDTRFEDHRARTGHRSLYVWSKAFNTQSNERILSLVRAQGIEEVLLSAGKSVNKDKFEAFIREAQIAGVTVTSILGANEWIFPENHRRAALDVAIKAEQTRRLHLDIEPHTMPGYHDDEARYLHHYLSLMRTLRQIIGERFLSVSVPVHWPESVYRELVKYVDQVYLMAYGSADADTIGRRLQNALKAIPKEKLVIALNLPDFQDAWMLEQTIIHLYGGLQVDRYALHSLKYFPALFAGSADEPRPSGWRTGRYNRQERRFAQPQAARQGGVQGGTP
ncbi:hypothetical protein [Methylohalobius crimeensis]|uniref:hypothetical protein n=1 Tax=Methylohalobius crimeensis TaxID=244365 RepID=UPI0003B353E4|nr:hypothetical protein [Methylohalobius crimeensis]